MVKGKWDELLNGEFTKSEIEELTGLTINKFKKESSKMGLKMSNKLKRNVLTKKVGRVYNVTK